MRSSADVNQRETACTPFLKVTNVQRTDSRCYATFRIDADSPFHDYLASINDQLMAFLCPIENLRMPYDANLRLLRVKIPVRGTRLAVRAYDASSLDEIPASVLAVGRCAAVEMTLNDVWLDAEVVLPTWVAERLVVRSN